MLLYKFERLYQSEDLLHNLSVEEFCLKQKYYQCKYIVSVVYVVNEILLHAIIDGRL